MSDDERDVGESALETRLRGGGKRGNGKHSKGASMRVTPAGGRGLEKKPSKQKPEAGQHHARDRNKAGSSDRQAQEGARQPRQAHNGLKKVDVNVIGSKSRVVIPEAVLALMRGGPEEDSTQADGERPSANGAAFAGPQTSAAADTDPAMMVDGGEINGKSTTRFHADGAAMRRAAAHGEAPPLADAGGDATAHNRNVDVTRRTYGAMLHKILEEADVLLEVLDARDPLSCRTWQVEHFVNTRRPELKIVLVLNKIDLVPKEAVAKWVKYLQAHHQVAVFKAVTAYAHRGNAAVQSSVPVHDATGGQLHSAESFGAPELVQALKGIGKSQLGFGGKGTLTVGVVGYPNVGKSSVINSLVRSKAAQTGDRAGVTKHTQTVRLDKGITIIDCPGVVLDDQADESRQLLTNCLPVDKARDLLSPVREIVARCGKELLSKFYGVGEFRDHTDFLCSVAQRRGKLLRGGEPDQEAAARGVLQDWNKGKLKYHTLPPEEEKFAGVIESTVVPALSPAFSLFSPSAEPATHHHAGSGADGVQPEEEEEAAERDDEGGEDEAL